MRSNRWVIFVTLVVSGAGLLALGNATSNGQAPAAKPGVIWEYQTQFGPNRQANDDLLNRAGQEGWELVAVGDDPRELVRYTFKRPKQK